MPAYQFAEPQGGQITLRSGRWQWIRTRVLSMPDQTCVSQTLTFGSLEHRGDIMRVTIPSDIELLEPHDLEGFARSPDDRRVVLERFQPPRELLVRESQGESGERELVFRLPGAVARTESPDGHSLADLTHDELITILDSVHP